MLLKNDFWGESGPEGKELHQPTRATLKRFWYGLPVFSHLAVSNAKYV
jgi:hypothetical protein